jgi:PAS domain S-box-containing protein
MTNQNDSGHDLRKRAEKYLKRKLSDFDAESTLSTQALRDVVHELQVHQIELEMQNEELSEAHLALQAAHDKYIDLYDYAPVGYLTVDNKGTVNEANLTATHLLGINRASLVGKPLSRFVFRDDLDDCYFKLQQVFETQKKLTCELRLVKENGDQFHAQIEGMTVDNKEGPPASARLALLDITERKKAEAAIEREHDIAQMYLDVAGVMLVALNAKGNVTLINAKGCQILGYEDHEIMGRNWFDVCLPEEFRKEVKNVFVKLTQDGIGDAEYYENPVLTSDGKQRIIAFHNTVLYDSSHGVSGILFSGEDVTDRRQAEEDKSKLIIELKNSLAQVKKLSGFLPICASCKKIRDDKGYWRQVEEYVSDHSEALFSHGICPDCMRKLYPEFADEVLATGNEKEDK